VSKQKLAVYLIIAAALAVFAFSVWVTPA